MLKEYSCLIKSHKKEISSLKDEKAILYRKFKDRDYYIEDLKQNVRQLSKKEGKFFNDNIQKIIE